MPAPILITVDGTAASGKGTLARLIAETYNGAWLDTGLLYRWVGYQADTADEAVVYAEKLGKTFSLDMLHGPKLRTEKASNGASVYGAIPAVRAALMDIQRNFGQTLPSGRDCVVMDGRDIGTIIAPQAPVKFFVDANVTIRAQRRVKELQSSPISVSYEAVLEAMRQRDARDKDRDVAPLKPAPDTLMIDTTTLSVVEMLGIACDHITKLTPELRAVR